MNPHIPRLNKYDYRHLIPVIGLFIKFLIFDMVWCYYTTFSPMSRLSTYTTALFVTLILSVPYVITRKRWIAITTLVIIDIWFICNLMYFMTYATAIPLSSYILAGNLVDFMPSVADSLRWNDILFPLSTVATAILMHLYPTGKDHLSLKGIIIYCITLALSFGTVIIPLSAKGGFMKEYSAIRSSAYLHSSCTPLFTLAGSLLYDYMYSSPSLTDEDIKYVSNYINAHSPITSTDSVSAIDNLIIIFAESLESWVINAHVEGKEITPYLNKLIEEPGTLYADKVLSQVGGGRSIDAQLLILAGLHPIQNGTYSSLYPDNTYFTLPKAMKSEKGTRNYLLTVDKTKVWNQGAVAKSFGIDTIISHPDWDHTEMFGTRHHLSDRAFLKQVQEKIERGEIWKPGEKTFMQIVTYSGHAPFKLPDNLKTISFSDNIPQVMNDYMTTAHFTDEAIGHLIEYLRLRPDFNRTMIVITGDHEGLAKYREDLVKTPGGHGVVSPYQFTPLIIVNSPRAGLIDNVIGQIDIYPTIMQLAGLEHYPWHGLGISAIDSHSPQAAVARNGIVHPATTTDSIKNRLQQALDISDRIIRFNMLQDLYGNQSPAPGQSTVDGKLTIKR